MASEKQVSYIKSLIEKMQPENHPMMRLREGERRLEMIQMLDLENVDTGGMNDDEIRAAFDKREDQINHMSHDDVLALYQAKIDDLASRDWSATDSRTASQTIDALKRYQFPK